MNYVELQIIVLLLGLRALEQQNEEIGEGIENALLSFGPGRYALGLYDPNGGCGWTYSLAKQRRDVEFHGYELAPDLWPDEREWEP